MEDKWQIQLQIIEQGDIYFFYKPKRDVTHAYSIEDVSRFFIVLAPSGDAPPRYIVMGNKKMPRINDGDKTSWGFVQIVGSRGFEIQSPQTEVRKKGASRPAGEGIYALLRHRDHTHLLYTLELPSSVGAVQRAFHIEREADYIIMERPVERSPTSPDAPFSNFSSMHTVANLNRRGTEVLLVGVGSDIGRLGITATKDRETVLTADIINRLKMNTNRHPLTALISGNWE
jgi:hypothetical protein